MSKAIQDLKDFLSKSPSVVFPDEVLEYVDAIEAENEKLLAERNYLFMNSNPTACELRRVRAEWKRDRKENAKLRELLSMYVSFARAFAEGCSLQRAYCDGMGKRMNETKMRESALELGVKECR